jgi:tetratricopeptide (TPR) repeat protein
MTKIARLFASTAFATGLYLLAAPAGAAIDVGDIGFSSHAGNYLIARSAGRNNDFSVAATFYKRAHEENPADQVLLERAFVLSVTNGEVEQSTELAEQIITTRPDHQLSRFVLGLREAREKNFAAARKHFLMADNNRIGQLTTAVLIAWTYAGEGNARAAYKALDELDKQGNLDKFKAAHKANVAVFLDDRKTADAAFKKAMAKVGNSLRLVDSYGTYLWKTDRQSEARVVFARFLNTTERNPIIIKKLADLNNGKPALQFINSPTDGMFEVFFALAGALSDRKNATVALIYSQLGLYLRPASDVGRVLVGEVYDGVKLHKDAIAAYSKVPVNSPLRSNVEIQMASDLDDLEKPDEAVALLNKLIAREPENFQAWFTKGTILYGREKWLDAADALSLSLARVETKKRQHWPVFYYRGMAYERAGRWEQAEPDLQMALKLRPAQPAVLNYLGYSWIDRGENLEEAMKMVRQAAELRPRDGYIIDSVGWALYRLGKYEEAVEKLERAVKLRPGDPTINDHLGDAYWKVGRKLEAGFQWAHARDSKPDKKALAIILKKLKDGLPDLPNKS